MEPAKDEETPSRFPRAVLRLPDLEHAKSAVLNSPASPESRRSYEFVIQNFLHWYCSEGELEQIQFLLGHASVQTTERYLGSKQNIKEAVNDHIGAEPSH